MSEKTESSSDPSGDHDGRWAKNEQELFIEALRLHGKNWKKVQAHIGSRTTTQVRSHAQKYFAKLGRKASKYDSSNSGIENSIEQKDCLPSIQTLPSTPVDSPLGGPCATTPDRSTCTTSTEKCPDQIPNTKRALPVTIDNIIEPSLEPENKVKVCPVARAIQEERFIMPYCSMPYQMAHQSVLQSLLYDQQLSKAETNIESGCDVGLSTEMTGETGLAEWSVEPNVHELEGFSLEVPQVKPLDLLQAVEQPAQQAVPNENMRTDFSSIFA